MATEQILDPICDMVVVLAEAREQRLTREHLEREYGFCSAGCLAKFAANPPAYVPKVAAWLAQQATTGHVEHQHRERAATEVPTIDAGIRAWYASCRCCLSEAHPSVVEILDAERESGRQAVSEGICEAAEGTETKTS